MTLLELVRNFGETTSIRGIPRALKSPYKLLVVVWSLAIVIFAGVLIAQLTLLLIKYYKYDYSTTYSQGTAKPVSGENVFERSPINLKNRSNQET